jgi:hypothetical protein
MMRVSGYSAEYCFNILKGVILKYRDMIAKEANGEIHNYYRNRRQMKDHKKANGGMTTSAT